MPKINLVATPLLVWALLAAPALAADDFKPEAIIALERSALDRWCKGDPQGFLETYSQDTSYFSPSEDHRVDGLAAMKDLLVPITGKIKIDSYEFLNARVQRRGDIAVLSYQVVTHRKGPDGQAVTVRWNSTAVYERTGGHWKSIHSHWSYTKPELKQANPE
jgi:ketosteroid isomerase-like protein